MQVYPSTFTIAEYCQQMKEGQIVVNQEYQRTSQVWPPAARSYLMDTILGGYPMPKFALYQKTDLRTRKTIKEIVDGQQRSQAIIDFFDGRFRITGRANLFTGLRLDQLDEDCQQQFLAYQLTVDVYVGATDTDIRQVFRRMNSYTAPLNDQEKRHATYQGEFKWFIAGLSQQYAEMLKGMGVFREAQLSRMADASLFTEVVYALTEGIQSASQTKLNNLYLINDDDFDGNSLTSMLSKALNRIMGWSAIFNGPLVRSYNFYSLLLAACHVYAGPVSSLEPLYSVQPGLFSDDNMAIVNLSRLAEVLEDSHTPKASQFSGFIQACSQATNQRKQRETRFQYFCRALAESHVA